MSDVPPNVLRREAGLPPYQVTDEQYKAAKEGRGAEYIRHLHQQRQWEYSVGGRVWCGRPRLRRSRRVLAGWLKRIAKEIE
jgi:hypothetical protein